MQTFPKISNNIKLNHIKYCLQIFEFFLTHFIVLQIQWSNVLGRTVLEPLMTLFDKFAETFNAAENYIKAACAVKGVGLGLFPSNSVESQSYDFDEIAHIGHIV